MLGLDKKSARYAVRRAERDGVRVQKAATPAEREAFFEFFGDFAREKGIPAVSREDLARYDVFLAHGPDGTFEGGAAFVAAPDRSVYRYKHGATRHRLNTNELLVWSAIKHAKAEGYALFDLGGSVLPDSGLAGYEGHHHFKKKFGGVVATYRCFVRGRGPLAYPLRLLDWIVREHWGGDYNQFVNSVNRVVPIRSK